MNIYALKGHKIRVKNFSCGYEHHQEVAKKYLTIGNVYTVERTKVSGCHTDVYLQEFPGVAFNSVFFKDVVEQPKEANKMHPDYLRFH